MKNDMPTSSYFDSHQNIASHVYAIHQYSTSDRRLEGCSLEKQASLREKIPRDTDNTDSALCRPMVKYSCWLNSFKTYRTTQWLFNASPLSLILSYEWEPIITGHLNKEFYKKKTKANKYTTKQKMKSEETESMFGAEQN